MLPSACIVGLLWEELFVKNFLGIIIKVMTWGEEKGHWPADAQIQVSVHSVHLMYRNLYINFPTLHTKTSQKRKINEWKLSNFAKSERFSITRN